MARDHFFEYPEISHRWGFQGIRKEKTSCESIFIDIPEAPPIAYFKILVPSSQSSREYFIADYFQEEGDEADYTYDFGRNDWNHAIIVESINLEFCAKIHLKPIESFSGADLKM